MGDSKATTDDSKAPTLYDLLGVSPDCDERTLKKAYQAKAREVHPDKNPDDPTATDRFQALQRAYEILRDPAKRKEYDEHGLDGIAEDDPKMEELFRKVFGIKDRIKAPRKLVTLKLTLEEFYAGASKAVEYDRMIQCEACAGTGSSDRADPVRCEACEGHGFLGILVNELIPARQDCDSCGGKGILPAESPCSQCSGSGAIATKAILEVRLPPGADEQTIVFHGNGDYERGREIGDVGVVLETLPHPLYERFGLNLKTVRSLTLSDALFGTRFPLRTLDGRTLVIKTDYHKTVQFGKVVRVIGEGFRKSGSVGDLFIRFEVTLPDHAKLKPALRKELCRAVPHRDYAKGVDTKSPDVSTPLLEDACEDDIIGAEDGDGEEEEEEAPESECAGM